MLKPWLSRNQTPEIIQNHPNSSRTLQNSQNPLPLSVQTLMFWYPKNLKILQNLHPQRPLPRSPPPLPLKALIFIRVVRVGAAERGSFEAAGVSVLLHGGKSCWNLREPFFCRWSVIIYISRVINNYCWLITADLSVSIYPISPLFTQLFTV